MGKLKESSCGGFTMGNTHGSIDTNASKDVMFITVTLFDEAVLGDKGFISAYMQNGWDDFFDAVEAANEKVITTRIAPKSEQKVSPSTVMIRMGEMKGRTVTAALEEFGAEKLKQHLQYLEGCEAKAPGKYPANIVLINEIRKVLSGPADEESGEETQQTYKLWDDDQWKSSPSKKNAKGWPLCSRLQITATPGSETPYLISISNGFAPVHQTKNGLMAIELSQMEEKKTVSLFVGRKDFMCAVKEANRRYNVFCEMRAAGLCRKQMEEVR